MKTVISTVLFIAFALLNAPVIANNKDKGDDHRRHHDRAPICEKSAKKMLQSCQFEINEEYYATTAKCINLGNADERESCLSEAAQARKEARNECRDQRDARSDVCELLSENRYDPEALLDTSNFLIEPNDSNPFFSLQPGHTFVARAGEDFEELIIVTVTDQVREILGVNCRLVVDIVLVKEDDEFIAVEVTDDHYAQALNGDVHYCGEIARNFEDGKLVDLDGSFEAGRDLAKSGILIKAQPQSGDAHRQEYLLGEAEDVIKYVSGVDTPASVGPGEGGDNPSFPCDGNCVKTEEFIPTEPGAGEYKYYLPGTGFVLGVGLDDGIPNGERDEVLCTGSSLNVLTDDARCGIAADDLPDILDQLCELSPQAFCSAD